MRGLILLLALLLPAAAGGCTGRRPGPGPASGSARPPGSGAQPGSGPAGVGSPSAAPPGGAPPPGAIATWVYQLQGYDGGRLDALARTKFPLVVIDLARDAHSDYFTPEEIAAVRATGKRVLAYFEIGSIEDFRPEYAPLRRDAGDLVLNKWPDWPQEYFVRYWDERWWSSVVAPRVDRAVKAGFDGIYLDTLLAYEEIDRGLVAGRDQDSLGRAMVALLVRISRYARQQRPGFWIVPQNSPELRHHQGYTEAIDGLAMEELFYQATDKPCQAGYCAENLTEARALRDAGKFVLAVDYAGQGGHVRDACQQYHKERFAGYVTVRDLDRVAAPCA